MYITNFMRTLNRCDMTPVYWGAVALALTVAAIEHTIPSGTWNYYRWVRIGILCCIGSAILVNIGCRCWRRCTAQLPDVTALPPMRQQELAYGYNNLLIDGQLISITDEPDLAAKAATIVYLITLLAKYDAAQITILPPERIETRKRRTCDTSIDKRQVPLSSPATPVQTSGRKVPLQEVRQHGRGQDIAPSAAPAATTAETPEPKSDICTCIFCNNEANGFWRWQATCSNPPKFITGPLCDKHAAELQESGNTPQVVGDETVLV